MARSEKKVFNGLKRIWSGLSFLSGCWFNIFTDHSMKNDLLQTTTRGYNSTSLITFSQCYTSSQFFDCNTLLITTKMALRQLFFQLVIKIWHQNNEDAIGVTDEQQILLWVNIEERHNYIGFLKPISQTSKCEWSCSCSVDKAIDEVG